MPHFSLKMFQIQFQLQLCPRTCWRSSQRTLWIWGQEEKWEREGEGKGRRQRGKGRCRGGWGEREREGVEKGIFAPWTWRDGLLWLALEGMDSSDWLSRLRLSTCELRVDISLDVWLFLRQSLFDEISSRTWRHTTILSWDTCYTHVRFFVQNAFLPVKLFAFVFRYVTVHIRLRFIDLLYT